MSETRQLRILAIGAHPDDIEFGCGGILLKEATGGAELHLLVCSKGEAGSNGSPETRVEECEAASARLGAALHLLDCGGDGKLTADKDTALALARAIRAVRPDIVLAPSLVADQHPDHYAIGAATREAARLARYAGLDLLREREAHAIRSLFYYAITPTAEPGGGTPLLFDVSEQKEEWVKLMDCHATQMKTRRYVELQLARSRALGLQAGCEYAQSLWSNDRLLLDSLATAPRGVRLY